MTIPRAFFEERVHRQRRQRARRARTRGGGRRPARGAPSRSSFAAAACSIRRPSRSSSPSARNTGFRSAETQAGKSATPADHPLSLGAVGVTGAGRGQPARRGGRRDPRASAPASPISPPARGRCSRTLPAVSSASTCSRSTPPSIAPCRWSPTRAPGWRRSTPRSATGRRQAPGARRRPRPRRNGRPSPPATPPRPISHCRRTPKCSAPCNAPARRPTSWSARRAACRANCTSSGGPARRSAIMSNTAIPAWATRSPAAIGVKMAQPDREVVVTVGDGSYLMMNSEIATSVMLGVKLIIVVNDNRRLWLHQPPATRHRRRAVQQPAARRAA